MDLKVRKVFSFCFLCAAACLSVLFFAELQKVLAEEGSSSSKKVYYIVREGDCLWNISERFYKDPYVWPAVWRNNAYITNPHRIFPGEPIYLTSAQQSRAPAPSFEQEPFEESQEEFVPIEDKPVAAKFPPVSTLHVSRFFVDTALLTDEEINEAGRVLAPESEKIMMAKEDDIYIQFAQPQHSSNDSTYQILRGLRKIRDPKTGKYIGTLYSILGYAKVTNQTTPQIARATVLASQDIILVGDILREGTTPPKEIYSKTVKRDIQGRVLTALNKVDLIAQHEVCFIDKGIVDGVENGDTFWVMKRGRKVEKQKKWGKVRLPETRQAMLVVVHAEKETATTYVAESRGVFEAGSSIQSRMD